LVEPKFRHETAFFCNWETVCCLEEQRADQKLKPNV